MYRKFEDIRKSFPWVIVDKTTHKILAIGTWEGMTHRGHKEGHLMTYNYYKQYIQEIYGETIEQFERDTTVDIPEVVLETEGQNN